MAKNVSGSGGINTGVRGWFGKGGGGVHTDGEMRPANEFSSSGNRQSSVAVNGSMSQGKSSTTEQPFSAPQHVGTKPYKAGAQQSFRPKTGGKVSG